MHWRLDTLGFRVFLAIAATSVLTAAAIIWNAVASQNEQVEKELLRTGHTASRLLARSAGPSLLAANREALAAQAAEALEGDVIFAAVYSLDGKPMAQAASPGWADHLAAAGDLRNGWKIVDAGGDRAYVFTREVVTRVMPAAEELLMGGETLEQPVGWVRVAIRDASIRDAARSSLYRTLAIAGLMLAAALALGAWLARALTRPMMEVAAFAAKVEQGDLSRRLPLQHGREARQLAQAFNAMLDGIARRDQELRRQQRLLETVLESLPVGVWLTSKDGGIVFTNRYFRSIFVEDSPKFTASCAASLQKEAECRSRERVMSQRGERILDVMCAPVEAGGFVGICVDVTDQVRQAEERSRLDQKLQHAQRLESLRMLAGGIAHDFNNILSVILGNATMAERRLTSDPIVAKEKLQTIVHSCERAAALCNQLLAYSGKGGFMAKALDLSALVEEITPVLRLSLNKGVELKLSLSRRLLPIEADEAQLRQMIMNLVANANEAIGDQSGVISIATGLMQADAAYLQDCFGADTQPGRYVYLEVADTGCGMAAETIERIFDPFFSTKGTGRGLGMSVVLGIVRSHGGALKINSEPGRGSTFKVMFPAAKAQAAAQTAQAEGEEGSWRGHGLVLVADDEDAVRETLMMMLEDMGFTTIGATDGAHALELFRQHMDEIALVVSDLTMPHMDGEELFRELRRIAPDVKVVLTSGYNEREAVQRFSDKGLDGFIQKPVMMEQLQRVLRKLFVVEEEPKQPARRATDGKGAR